MWPFYSQGVISVLRILWYLRNQVLKKNMISIITTIVSASILDLILDNKKSFLGKDSHRWLWVNWVGSVHVCDGLGMETGECLNSESHTGNVNLTDRGHRRLVPQRWIDDLIPKHQGVIPYLWLIPSVWFQKSKVDQYLHL